VLSTIHSAKGQEWNAVHILNVVDGCMPADMATGQRGRDPKKSAACSTWP
jgi:DNA helicase-2/ATP-dependent DNA helicase PcrA